MAKVYTDKDVYTAALERYEYIYDSFDNYYFSISGGKDSSVMIQLAAQVARKKKKKISVLYVDFEAQYKATIEHVYDLIEEIKDVLDEFYWIALPISLRNAVSVIQPKWICWDKKDKDKWVRPMPKNEYVVNEDNYPTDWTWFKRGMEFEEFILYFADYFNKKHGGITACGIAIRSDESLNRFRTIINKRKEKFNDKNWTTRIKIGNRKTNSYSVFPIYDWKVEDIWTCVAKYDLIFNEIYEQMYKNGVTVFEQRLCQPYGDDQKKGLNQFRALEAETWEKVVSRVHGVNFGNIYCRTSVLGVTKTQKPDSMTWQEYAIFLLESIGIYAPELRDHYYRKIKTFLKWYKDKYNIDVNDIKDYDKISLENSKKVPTWRRIARAIEKNDFWMKSLSFNQTKSDVKLLFELQKKYRNLLDDKTKKQLDKLKQGGHLCLK